MYAYIHFYIILKWKIENIWVFENYIKSGLEFTLISIWIIDNFFKKKKKNKNNYIIIIYVFL